MIASDQIRAARNALRWSVDELARRSGVSARTIKRMEAAEGIPNSNAPNIASLRATLEDAGIEFIGTPDDAPGIRIHRVQDRKAK